MQPAASAGAPAGRRTFRRTTGSRLVGSACSLLFTGGAVSAAAADGASLAFFLLLGLSGISLVNLAGVWADRYVLDEAGIEYRNPVLLGRRTHRVAWEEIESAREVYPLRRDRGTSPPAAMFLTLRSGKRMVLDSLEGLTDLMAAVRQSIR